MRWYRAEVTLSAGADPLDPLFLRYRAFPRAQEFRWDGELIGTNGRVSSDAAGEIPGRLLATFPVPRRLAGAGVHEILIRVSNQGGFAGGLGDATLGTHRALQISTHVENALIAFLAGIFAITAVFQFANFLSSIRSGSVLFSAFCLGCVVQILPERLGIYLCADLDALQGLITAGTLGWCAMMTALPLFFLGGFTALPRRALACAGGLAAATTLTLSAMAAGLVPYRWSAFLFPANSALGFLAVAASLAAAAWGMRRGRPGALPAALGLACLLAGVAVSHLAGGEWPWGIGLAALILFQHASLSRMWKDRGQEQKETQLRASRLEIELLKKNIQPHFLLHSLRAITDLLLKDPSAAARLVNALAGELRMMLKMSQEKAIPLAEEIRLCRSHLEVLSLRGGLELTLSEEGGTDPDAAIPPMVLHTLLEQGLEEADASARAIRFRLRIDSGDKLALRLSHDAPVRPASAFPRDATGMLYARARLEEAFPGGWSLDAGVDPADGAWRAIVAIRAARAAARA